MKMVDVPYSAHSIAFIRVLVFGGRAFSDYNRLATALNHAYALWPKMCVVQGGCRGADLLGKAWAVGRGIPCAQMDAPWNFYGNSAGPMRNQWMLDYFSPHVGVCFPGDNGTADMRNRLEKMGTVVYDG